MFAFGYIKLTHNALREITLLEKWDDLPLIDVNIHLKTQEKVTLFKIGPEFFNRYYQFFNMQVSYINIPVAALHKVEKNKIADINVNMKRAHEYAIHTLKGRCPEQLIQLELDWQDKKWKLALQA